MSPRRLLRLGLRGLLIHRLRSVLSILGVVFGVAAVVAMASVGEGARREALAQIGELGIDTFAVRVRPGAEGPGLRLADAGAVEAVLPRILGLAPLREMPLAVSSAGAKTDATVLGTVPGYGRAARLSLAQGRFLADLDVRDRQRVAVLGAAVARALFPLGEAAGQRVRVGGDWYDVVGVLKGRAAARSRPGPIRTRDVDRAVFVPLPCLDRGLDPRPDGIDEIVVRVAEGVDVVEAAEVARACLRRTSGGAPVDLIVPREILRQKERTQRIFNVVTGAVAGIGLLVGGIGIMNIMLASVAERTREVGIRRAVGATRRDITWQFLTESSLLTATGGLVGATLGVAGSFSIERLAGWPTALSLGMLLGALVTALAVGIGFGLYPATAAARLDPMEALRHE